ncbi:MAG: asparagine synthase (glutamine-hydrolyzing) [Deltaproteobacteria bacterium]|nr:asparagine synthase (glutamine-hydrolyzing) [Deltaproteobacteria bacterium]
MCGIAGVATADPKAIVEYELLKSMTDIVAHRGPDGEGFHVSPGVGLGMRRLSIIDLETGNQPISSEDGSITIICNGEIYNYLELRKELLARGHRFCGKSDVEVIVHLYEEEGICCLQRLRGMFAFALWDAKKRELLLARDRYGIKPLDYAIAQDGTLYFGSELKSILAVAPIDRSVDSEAVEDLFIFGYILSPKTLFKEIKKVMPGHYLVFRQGQVRHERYYDYVLSGEQQAHKTISAAEWAELVSEKLSESIRLHLRSDVPICAWLSAGIDSSAIAAITSKLVSSPLQTYSLTFEDKRYDEVSNQRTLDAFPDYGLLNQRVLCSHDHFELFRESVWHGEEPTTSGLHMAQMILAKAAGDNYKVALTGEGSDEIFAGYKWHKFDKLFSLISWMPQPLKQVMMLGSVLPKWKPWATRIFLSPRDCDLIKYAHFNGGYGGHYVEGIMSDALKCEASAYDPHHQTLTENDRTRWSRIEKGLYLDMRVRLPDFITNGLDRMSMSSSLEARVPFLDHEFVELCAKIPSSLKLKFRQEKYVLRQAMRKHLPSEIVQRKKRGLRAPNDSWLRGEMSPYVEEMLSTKRIKENGYFNEKTVRGYLEQHRAGKGNFARPLMASLCVQVWDELFVKGCHPQ